MRARSTIEMMGSPAEYVEKALKKIEERIRVEYDIKEIKYEKPVKVGEKYFSVFFESEIEFKDFVSLIRFIMDFGPSTFEVLETKPIKINPLELQNAANDITSVMHEQLKFNTMLKAQLKVAQRQALEAKVNNAQAAKGKETKIKPEKATEKPQTAKKDQKPKGNK